jgi:hypothetical protein
MSSPFAHDTTSNAQTDFSFADDQGVPDRHLVSFQQAMSAPSSNLGEADYRYPGLRPGQQIPADQQKPPVEQWQAPASPQYGQYPRPYAL